MSTFETAISVFLVFVWLYLLFSGKFAPTEEDLSEEQPYQSGWLSNDKPKVEVQDEDDFPAYGRYNSEPEVEPESPMQKFRRQNTLSECVRRGGFLTTGERMEAMYGPCEEAASCFPEEYYQ